ncbi:murein biosynthesis integral membrane protein MurJ [Leptotrichia sp. oral taxon 221]|uniref:murein biosynthesis integral membrane protein MurJ n=1 Tax=Leptotrichia sp. oral taxon 221 TaxID=712362 RepID=UPI001B8AF951|nr:murein biosynthesis integral membrane protein MurJ [Leptotrichia sp. oral taxon 221]QUB96404.1 murein biosynthesis integral membrane protein MurJ [Leptotrichia sp. oral taxon 221]
MFKSSFIVMVINMLSRILGLVREMIIGSVFGASGMTDAYVSATKIPNFFTTLFGEGSLGTVFIPIYNRGLEEKGKEKTDEFVFSILNLIIAFTSTMSVIMILFSKQILKITTGFADPERFEAANGLLKIVAFYFLFIALSGVVSSLLNNYKKFAVAASMGIVFNLVIIVGTLLLKNKMGIYGLGVAYLLSGVFQLLMMLPQFFQIMKTYKFVFNLKDPYVKEMFVLMVPTLIGIFGYQINEIVDNRFATMLPAGTASALNYASRLYLLPIGVFAISLSVVIFPTLSRAVVKNKRKKVRKVVQEGLAMLAFLIVPSSVILFGYAREIVTLVYKRGHFSNKAVTLTSETLQFYALGLLFFSTIHLLTRSHYVYKDRKLPVISSFIGIFTNILLDFLLYKQYRHVGLTFATSFAAMINFLILFVSLQRRYVRINVLKYIAILVISLGGSLLSFTISKLVKVSFLGSLGIVVNLLIFLIIYLLIWIAVFMIFADDKFKKDVARRFIKR